jgi:hypothetical protein
MAGDPALAGGPPGGARADGLRHSGTIVAVDQAKGTITMDEMGPWYGEGTGVRRVILPLRSDIQAALVQRTASPGADGWPGAYTALPLSLADLRVGDHITVKTTEGPGAVLLVEVVRPGNKDDEGRTEVPAASPSFELPPRPRAAPGAPQGDK